MNRTTERFWSKVLGEPNSGCWLWMCKISDRGYGLLRVGEKWARSHRLSWEMHNGAIPNGLHVLHRCDTPSCVNPAHLFLGTHADNMADMARKGRARCVGRAGDTNPLARLSESDVQRIRTADEHVTALAVRFNVSVSAVYKIRAGKRWRHAA